MGKTRVTLCPVKLHMNYYLAVDIGASSGRHILSHIENGKIILEEIYRFDNIQIRENGHDCWNISYLIDEVITGISKCKDTAIPKTIGIDTWAVDYVLLDENDEIIGNPVAYRDDRTIGMKEKSEKIISATDLYKRAGIQYQPFNTLFQLLSEPKENLEKAKTFLMIPEYLNYILTGVKMNEYTNATSTNLVGAESKTWDMQLIEKFDFPKELFKKLYMPQTIVGEFSEAIQKRIGFNSSVILPATHDTGSAFLAVPAVDDNCVYISSGTWSLLGTENKHAITTEESRLENFTNEGGAWYRYRYLKNIMGLWIIQSIRRELNGVDYVKNKNSKTQESVKKYSFDDLVDLAKEADYFDTIIDVDDISFLSPPSMIDAIKNYCKNNSLDVPQTVGELMQCVYLSLTHKYAKTIKDLEKITHKTYTSINIIGGGCKDDYINELTSKMTGLPVLAGPTEGTALGNLIVQMIANGEFKDLKSARNAVRKSFEIKTFITP